MIPIHDAVDNCPLCGAPGSAYVNNAMVSYKITCHNVVACGAQVAANDFAQCKSMWSHGDGPKESAPAARFWPDRGPESLKAMREYNERVIEQKAESIRHYKATLFNTQRLLENDQVAITSLLDTNQKIADDLALIALHGLSGEEATP